MNRAERRRQRKKAGGKVKISKPGRAANRSPEQQALSIQQALDLALRHHTAGRLPQAETIYQQILQAGPNQPAALHLLGVIAHQRGKNDIAVDLITRALAIKPDYAEAHNNLGLALQDLGNLDEAAASFHKGLAVKPDYAEAHNNLGNVLQTLGKLDEAAASYHQALAIKPDYAEPHYNLGNTLRALGKLDEAAASYHNALAIKPDYAKAHTNLGDAFRALGKLDEAATSYHNALAIKPDLAEAHSNLGLVLKALGKPDEAVASFREALAIKPDYAEAHSNLGDALKALGKLDEAVASYHRALAIKPDYAEAHNNLGNALKALGKPDEAAASYHDALAVKPDLAEAHSNLGLVLKALGRLDEAAASYRKALALKPDFTEAHLHLAVVSKFSEYDNDVKAMEDTYAMPGLSDEQRMYLAFGLGKSFEDLQQHEKAFGFFATANALKRKTCDFSIAGVEKNTGNLKKLFAENLFAKHHRAGSPDETPIFVLGMPRSGTTLVEQILASHPKVHGAGEISDLDQVVTSYFGKSGGAKFINSVDRASADRFLNAGNEYISRIREHSDTAGFITNKMPSNFWLIGMIGLMLPNAKIIHCRRDSRDICLSIFKNYFSGDGNYYAYDLAELGRYYNLYRDLMKHWHGVLPDFIYDISYEDVVANQERESRALLEHCGLEWDPACLEFHRTDRPVHTASAAQVRRPIYKDSVQLWKRYEKQLAPLLEVL